MAAKNNSDEWFNIVIRYFQRRNKPCIPAAMSTDRSKAVLPFRIFHGFFCHVFVMPLRASGYLCLLVTCRERTDLLALVCGV